MLENQAGQGLQLDPESRKALVMGLALHEQGHQQMQQVCDVTHDIISGVVDKAGLELLHSISIVLFQRMSSCACSPSVRNSIKGTCAVKAEHHCIAPVLFKLASCAFVPVIVPSADITSIS